MLISLHSNCHRDAFNSWSRPLRLGANDRKEPETRGSCTPSFHSLHSIGPMTMQAVETHGHTTLRPLEPDPGKIMAAVRKIRTHRQEQQPRHTPASNHPLVGAPYSSRTDRARSHKRSQTSDPLHRKGGTGSGSPAILSGTNSKEGGHSRSAKYAAASNAYIE